MPLGALSQKRVCRPALTVETRRQVRLFVRRLPLLVGVVRLLVPFLTTRLA